MYIGAWQEYRFAKMKRETIEMLHRAAMSVPRSGSLDPDSWRSNTLRTAPARTSPDARKKRSVKLRRAGNEFVLSSKPYKRRSRLADFHSNEKRESEPELSIHGNRSSFRTASGRKKSKRLNEIERMRKTYITPKKSSPRRIRSSRFTSPPTSRRSVDSSSPRNRLARFTSPPVSRRSVESSSTAVDDHEVDELIQWTSKLDMSTSSHDALDDLIMDHL